jgi:spermidine/putrescine transport system ATP-binding protein
MSMADTIAVMNKGRIEQAGTAEDLYERPHTAFVANFLGISNLVDGKVLERGAEMATVATDDGTVHVPCSRMEEAPGDAVRIGVRPEKIELVPAAAGVPAGQNALRGTVTVASFLGVSIQYVITAPGGEELTVVAPNRDGAQPHALGAGQDVLLTWDPRHTFVVTRDA